MVFAGEGATAGKPLPPGSLGLPWIGETLAFVKDSFAFFAERRQKYGPVFKTRLLGEPVVCLTGPDAVSFAGYVPLLERIIRRYLGNWGEEGSLLWVPELQVMCFDAANTLFAGASPDSSDRDAFNAFARMSAGFLALPVKLTFTRYGRALKGRDELRGYLHQRITAAPSAAGTTDVLGRLRACERGHRPG